MDLAIVFLSILVIPCILFAVINTICNKYKDVNNKKRLSGFEIAREILDDDDLKDVYIVDVKGNLNDHYDYDQKVLRLSSDVFHGESITSALVAARITNYAIQDKDNYTFMKFKFAFNRVITFVNYLAYIFFVIAICASNDAIMKVANIALGLVFSVKTPSFPIKCLNISEPMISPLLFAMLVSETVIVHSS